MKIKLIDVVTETYDTTFGTCELCIHTGEATEPTFHFQKEDGTEFEVEGYYWNWGDLSTIYVDNIIELADFISRQTYPDDTTFDYCWLDSEVDKCYAKLIEEEDK